MSAPQLACAALALAFGFTGSAGVGVGVATGAPAAGSTTAFVVPKPLERELKNHLKIYIIEDHRLPRVHYRLNVRAGAADEPADKAGLANLMLLSLRQGTTARDAGALAHDIDGVGGNVGVSAGRDQMAITGQFLARDWKVGLGLLSELALQPAFRNEEIERQRSQILARRESSRDQNASIANEHAAALVYGEHPYGRPIEGEAASISNLTRDDVVAFHAAAFRPNNALLVVVGDVETSEVLGEIDALFRDWASAEPPAHSAEAPPAFDSTRIRLLDKPGVTQTELVVGLPGAPRSTPDYFAMQTMNYILGGGGSASRLVQNARSRAGLTYGVNTSFDTGLDAGGFFLSTFTKNASVRAMLDVCRTTMREFTAQGPTPKELADAKSFVVGSLPFAVQTAAGLAAQWAAVDLYGLGLDYYDHFSERVQAVTAGDVKAAAAKYLRDDRFDIVAVGTADSVKAQLDSLGTVEVLDYRSPTGTVPQSKPRVTAPSESLTPEAIAKAKGVLERALAAHGGVARLKAVTDVSTRANIKFTTPNGTLDGEMAVTVRPPDRSRIEMSLLGQRGVQVLNGASGWSSTGDRVQDLSSEQLEGLRAGIHIQVLPFLARLASGGAQAGWLREDRIGGEPVDVLQITDGAEQARASFSKKNGLLLRLEQDEPGMFGGGTMPMTRLYLDYRTVSGYQVPFKTERYARDVRIFEDAVSSYEVNRGAPESLFTRPTR